MNFESKNLAIALIIVGILVFAWFAFLLLEPSNAISGYGEFRLWVAIVILPPLLIIMGVRGLVFQYRLNKILDEGGNDKQPSGDNGEK